MLSPFFQRSIIEKRIIQRVESLKKGFRQNLSVLGPDGIGKTHLLETIYRHLGRDKDILTVYVQCAAALDFSDLAERWITAILASVISARDEWQEPVSTHLAVLETSLPKTVERVRSLRKMVRRGEKNTAAVRELLGLTAVLAGETGKKIVLILDEFHALEDLPVPDPFGLLGHEIMLEKNTLYLVASSRPSLALEIFKNQLSLLFSNFETMKMGSLDSSETVQFIEERLPGMLFSDAQKKFIVSVSGGIPLYLNLLLEHLRRLGDVHAAEGVRETMAVTLADANLLQGVESEVFELHGRLSQIFQSRLERSLGSVNDGAIFYHGLVAVSEGARKIQVIAAHMERKTAECKKILQRLVQEELITKVNDFYYIEDSLFSFWIREVFAARSRQSIPFKDDRKNFCKTLAQILNQTDLEGIETVNRQIESLFKSFHNEVLQLGHKKIRLPHFDEVSVRFSGAGRASAFSAAGVVVEWYGRVAHELVHEEDVLLLKEETRKGSKKKCMRLMIALGGIDQNAKLMAQDAGIHLWLLEDINRLFLLFNLPQLIGTRKLDGSTLGTLAQSIYPA